MKPPQVKLREEKKPGLAGERKKVVFLKNDGFSHGGFVCPVVLKSDAAEDGEYMEVSIGRGPVNTASTLSTHRRRLLHMETATSITLTSILRVVFPRKGPIRAETAAW